MKYAPRSQVDDLEAVDAWVAGDLKAGEFLIRRHYRSVYGFFYGKVEREVCQDLTQLTLEALCASRDRFHQTSTFAGFLFGIARNKLLMHLRSQRRYNAVFDPFVDSCATPKQDQSLISLLGAREQELLVARSLARMPVDDQIILELHDYEGLTRRQLAEVLDIPQGTVSSRVRRSRTRLQALIAELANDKGLALASMHGLDSCMRDIRGSMDSELRGRVANAAD